MVTGYCSGRDCGGHTRCVFKSSEDKPPPCNKPARPNKQCHSEAPVKRARVLTSARVGARNLLLPKTWPTILLSSSCLECDDMAKTYFVYLMSNKSRRLYVGITSELVARVIKHKNKHYESSFTARYNFDMLVYFEPFSDPNEAIHREKEIKGWRREKKLRLIL